MNSKLRIFLKTFGWNSLTSNLVTLFMTLSFLYTSGRYANDIINGGDPYLTGDWLINYSGGFTSRGLIGHFLLILSSTIGTNLLWTAYFVQVFIYLIFVLLTILIFRNIKDSFIWMIGLSPFFLIFDFLDTGGSFRKENMGFACLALLASALVFEKYLLTLMTFSSIIFFFFCFSWEGGLSFLPIIILFLARIYRRQKITKIHLCLNIIFYCLTTLTSFIAIIYSQKNLSDLSSKKVCQSLTSRGLDENICSGRILSINNNGQVQVLDGLEKLWQQYNGTRFIPLLLLGLLPLAISGWIAANRFVFVVLIVSVVPLFLVPTDYGRNLHILGVFLSLSWAVDKFGQNNFSPDITEQSHLKTKGLYFTIFSILYTTLWRLPALGVQDGSEFFGVAARITSWILKLFNLLA